MQHVRGRTRINTEPLDARELDWAEARAWDGVAEFYKTLHQGA